jgi:hypothetical protein
MDPMRDYVRDYVRDSNRDEGWCSSSRSHILRLQLLDANLEKEYPVSCKGDNGGYGQLRSVGPSLLVYALATRDAV